MDQEQLDRTCASNVFWLYGFAGAGKSIIVNTVAKTLTSDDTYLECYFCARHSSDATPPTLIPTLAYQLLSVAVFCGPYREALMRQLGTKNGLVALKGTSVSPVVFPLTSNIAHCAE